MERLAEEEETGRGGRGAMEHMLSEGTTKGKKQQRLDSYKPRRSGVRAWGRQV